MTTSSTFNIIRAKHNELLRRMSGAATAEQLREIEQFIAAVRQAGRTVADPDDREYLRSILTFWGNRVYGETRTYPNTNLEPSEQPAPETPRHPPTTRAAPPSPARPNWLLWGLGGLIVSGIACALLAIVILPGVFPFSAPATEKPTQAPEVPTATDLPIFDLPTEQPTQEIFLPTPTALPNTGGGGGASSTVGLISVQLISPYIGGVYETGSVIEIAAAYHNLQPNWRLFFASADVYHGYITTFFNPSLPIDYANTTGLWRNTVAYKVPGYYAISVYIATSAASIEVLQALADRSAEVYSSEVIDGVIVFENLGEIYIP